MAKFFVGQRVRIVRARHPTNNGLTGVISHIGPWKYLEILPSGRALGEEQADCYVRLDSPRHDGAMSGANSYWQLEPILPEGAQPIGYSFEQMMSEFGVTEAVK
ncbi:hypothetical protein CUB19_gp50 [Stenotrophomonas phage CUB19]|nr:hypothetical protein CUB19_gp50 [Stenotrophomonas phage CUB19]